MWMITPVYRLAERIQVYLFIKCPVRTCVVVQPVVKTLSSGMERARGFSDPLVGELDSTCPN